MKTIIRIQHENGGGLWRARDNNGNDYCDKFTFIND